MKIKLYPPEIYDLALNWLTAEVVALATLGILFTTQPSVVWFGVAGFALCFGVVVIRPRSVQHAAFAIIGGLWLLNSLALATYPGLSLPAYLFGPLIIAGTNVLPWRANFVMYGASVAVMIGLSTPALPIVVLILTCIACSLFAYGLRRALVIALDHQQYVVQQMEMARQHRGELARLAKALQESQESLQMMNSQLRYARNSAEEAKRLKAQFAANVSHELRTPINLVIGFAEVIAISPESYPVPLPAPFRADVLAIYRNARHLQGLINDILDISQIESAHLSVVKEPTVLADLLREVGSMVNDMVTGKGLRLELGIAPDLPMIRVDRTRIRQVLINLLANSVRFTDSGWIKLSAVVVGSDIHIGVQDSGVGIPPAQLHQVFEEFYQVDSGDERRTGGTGLGLTLSKKFIEQHGGSLRAESSGIPGQGSTFSFTLPLAIKQPRSVTEAWRNTMPEIDKQPILIWDDDPAVGRLFEGYLASYPVRSTNSVDELLSLLGQNYVPLVIVPIGHPDIVVRIRQIRPDVPVIECPMPSGRRMLREYNIADYLTKPVSRRALLNALEQLGTKVKRVMIIDDQPDLLRMFTRYLSTAINEYTIDTANNGKEGLEKMIAQPPDLVILDIIMPGLDGFGVISHMKADFRLAAIPIVVVSAHGASEAVTATTYGDFTLRKPSGFMPLELVKCVEALANSLNQGNLLIDGEKPDRLASAPAAP